MWGVPEKYKQVGSGPNGSNMEEMLIAQYIQKQMVIKAKSPEVAKKSMKQAERRV